MMYTACTIPGIYPRRVNRIEIIRQTVYDLNPEKLSGRVVGIPIVNLPEWLVSRPTTLVRRQKFRESSILCVLLATPQPTGARVSAENAGILPRTPGLAYAGLVLTPLFWAGNAVVARGTVENIPPLSMSFWRWIIALAILLPFGLPGVWRHRQVIRQHFRSMLTLATFSVAAFNSLLYFAATTTTATNIALINATIPIFVALLAWILLGDRTRPIQALGIALAIIGIVTVVARGDIAVLTGLQTQPGDLIMVAAVFSWGLFSVLLRRQAVPLPALTFLTTQILLGTLVILPFYLTDLLFFAGGFDLSRSTALPRLYFAIFPGILAYAFWNHGVHKIGPARAAIFMYLTPVFASVLAGVFLGESLGVFHIIGGLLILAGLLLATQTGKRAHYRIKEQQAKGDSHD